MDAHAEAARRQLAKALPEVPVFDALEVPKVHPGDWVVVREADGTLIWEGRIPLDQPDATR